MLSMFTLMPTLLDVSTLVYQPPVTLFYSITVVYHSSRRNNPRSQNHLPKPNLLLWLMVPAISDGSLRALPISVSLLLLLWMPITPVHTFSLSTLKLMFEQNTSLSTTLLLVKRCKTIFSLNLRLNRQTTVPISAPKS